MPKMSLASVEWEWNQVVSDMTPAEAEAWCSLRDDSYCGFAEKQLNSPDVAALVDEFLKVGGYTLRKRNRDAVRFAMCQSIVGELDKAGKVCHVCGTSSESVSRHRFGMVHVYAERFNWGRFLGTLGVGAITGVLFGLAPLPSLAKDKHGLVVKPYLNLCKTCAEERRGWFGGVSLNEEDCRCHPLWNKFQSLFPMKFIPPSRLYEWE